MLREKLPIDQLALWARLNNVECNGVEAAAFPDGRGSGLVSTTSNSDANKALVVVPRELVLSLENVWLYAKADPELLQVLEAIGEYSRTARGAILIFLLLKLTNHATHGKIGVSNPLSEYVKFLPTEIALPTFWDNAGRRLLTGTSLELALDDKLKSLAREYTILKEKTLAIQWCREHWWDDESGKLSFDDWKQVDAIYRSRALDLPGTGHAMVPFVDMANHASGNNTSALYETANNGDALLLLRDGKILAANEEITITYGDEKGVCEMVFSYGFIESTMTSAKELFLDLDLPDDDPLRMAKKAAAKSPPGFRLFGNGDTIDWEGNFVWLLCVNEEDGLHFEVLQSIDGQRELQAFWKDKEMIDFSTLQNILAEEGLWDVFQLRAVTAVQARVEQQLIRMAGNERHIQENPEMEQTRRDVRVNALKLRDLEETLMLHAYEEFESRKLKLLESPVVQGYLGLTSAENATMLKDDFS